MTAQPLRIEARRPVPVSGGLPGESLVRGRHVHFMGIGGVGVSALARLASAAGAEVSGCDAKVGARAASLVSEGIRVRAGHSPDHVERADVLVHTGAVRPNEPELLAARARGVEVVDRLPWLLRVAEGKRLFGVAGSHGKTTTTTFAASLLMEAGLDPSCAVGGESEAVGSNARAGRGDWFVAEIDESDGHIADATCEVAVLTNVDREHFDHYDTFESICRTFGRFLSNVPADGTAVVCADSAAAMALARASGRRVLSYGFHRAADFRAEDVRMAEGCSAFRVAAPTGPIDDLLVAMPGIHNVQNATAVVAAAASLGIDEDALRSALSRPPRIERRLETYELRCGARMIVDYAHHPAKVAALVASVGLAAGPSTPGRVIAVFQPHRYTRTKHLGAEFGPAFAGRMPAHLPQADPRPVDGLIVLPIYAASEDPIPGVTGEIVSDSARRAGVRCARYVESREEATEELLREVRELREGDTVLIVGAGDVNALADELRRRS